MSCFALPLIGQIIELIAQVVEIIIFKTWAAAGRPTNRDVVISQWEIGDDTNAGWLRADTHRSRAEVVQCWCRCKGVGCHSCSPVLPV